MARPTPVGAPHSRSEWVTRQFTLVHIHTFLAHNERSGALDPDRDGR